MDGMDLIKKAEAAMDAILANIEGITASCRTLSEQLAAEREMLEVEGTIEPEPKPKQNRNRD